MKEVLVHLARALGLGTWLRWQSRRSLLVLMYHGVVEEALEPFCWHQLPVAAFREQLGWIARHYRVLPLEQALELRAKSELPERSCAITFDDGFANVAEHAVPVLEELRLPATVFLVTDLVGTNTVPWPDRLWLAHEQAGVPGADARIEELKTRPKAEKDERVAETIAALGVAEPLEAGPFRMMSWSEVGRLAEEGLVAFGPHSRTHEILSRCDDAEVTRQVAGSQAVLAERLPVPPRVFAYPNGRRQDYDERAKAAVARAGLAWALTTEEGLVDETADPLALPRVLVGSDLSFARFQLLCSGKVGRKERSPS